MVSTAKHRTSTPKEEILRLAQHDKTGCLWLFAYALSPYLLLILCSINKAALLEPGHHAAQVLSNHLRGVTLARFT